ncbi:MAG: hypothetical protein COB26_00250 [Piscirickettsiaceae bacterium]|nr:MAG: hypothetical protein COB26_06995 [Piscirickettsiaceae bacterium]PCI72383.1 MAG: hypothetical protein COB26_00250 [Piscirickettsiaceae bacterium]
MVKTPASFKYPVITVLLLICISKSLHADQNDPLLNALFNKLHETNSIRHAKNVEFEIMRLWNLSGNKHIDERMSLSDTAMRESSFKKALTLATSITEEGPTFSEGWNLQAIILFFMGRYDESLKSVEKTLALEPRHFGAMIGKGDMLARQGRLKAVRNALQRVLILYPLYTSGLYKG